jgi:hypothetical protein
MYNGGACEVFFRHYIGQGEGLICVFRMGRLSVNKENIGKLSAFLWDVKRLLLPDFAGEES